MKKLKKSCVQNNDLSKSNYNKSDKKKFIFTLIELIICIAFIVLLIVPYVKDQRYIYPIPDGQDTPNMLTRYWSFLTVGLNEKNPLGLITIILLSLTIVTTVIWFVKNKTKKSRLLFYINVSLFVINFILFTTTILYQYTTLYSA